MNKRPFPLSKAYTLLEPGPVVLLTTRHRGQANVMAMSWHTMMEFEPPLVGCIVSERDFSFRALKATRECALNIPTEELAREVIGCGNTSGRKVDKFAAFGLTAESGSLVDAPLIGECYASLECRVIDIRFVKRYDFFVLEVVKAWSDPRCRNPHTLHHRGRGLFGVARDTIRLPSKVK